MRRRPVFVCVLALAGCSGGAGGSHGVPLPNVPATAVPLAPATFAFIIPRKSSVSKRAPRYITAATQSIALQVTSVKKPGTNVDETATLPPGATAPQIANVGNTSGDPNVPGQCGSDPANAQNVKCTEVFQLPVGDTSVTIATFDGPQASGNRISQQRTVLAVQQGANTFAVTLDANAQSITVTSSDAALVGNANGPFTVYTASDVAAGVVVADAHGSPIGPAAPGASVLSASSSDTMVLTVSISGSTLTIHPVASSGHASVTVTATPANAGDGLTGATVTFTVTLAVPASTLFAGSADLINVFPASAAGTATPQRQISGFYVYRPPAPRYYTEYLSGLAAGAQSGVVDVLITQDMQGVSPANKTIEYGPAANGTAPVQNSYANQGGAAGVAIARVPGGLFDVLASNDHVQQYAGTGNGQQNSRFDTTPAGGVTGIAVEADGTVDVGATNPGRVDRYAANSSGVATPIGSISTGQLQPGPIAIGADGTLYVVEWTGFPEISTIQEFAPGAATPARTLGPFAPGTTVPAIAVDPQNELYVALSVYGGQFGSTLTGNTIAVYAPGASGVATPIRTLLNPLAQENATAPLVSIAVGN